MTSEGNGFGEALRNGIPKDKDRNGLGSPVLVKDLCYYSTNDLCSSLNSTLRVLKILSTYILSYKKNF